MKTNLLVALVLAAAMTLPLFANHEDEVVIMDETPLDHWWPYQYVVPEKRLAESSTWNPSMDEANPISDRKAVQIAIENLKKYVEDIGDYELCGVELLAESVSVKESEYPVDRWYWVVSFFKTAIGGLGGAPPTTKIVVLLNGWTPLLKKLKGEDKELAENQLKKAHQTDYEEGKESEVLKLVASDPIASELVTNFDFFPRTFSQSYSESKDETLQNNRYFTCYRLLAAKRTKDSELPSIGWSHWVEVTIENNSSNEFMNVRGVSFTALREGDAWPCFRTDKIIRLNQEGTIKEVLTPKTEPAKAGSKQLDSLPEPK